MQFMKVIWRAWNASTIGTSISNADLWRVLQRPRVGLYLAEFSSLNFSLETVFLTLFFKSQHNPLIAM